MPKMSIKNIVIKSINFATNSEFEPSDNNSEFQYQIGVDSILHEDGSIETLVNVKTPDKSDSPDFPFFFDITAQGFFVFSEKPEPKILEQLKTINCPAIIFPYLREAIADLTRRAGFPALHLPSVNFVKLNQNNSMKNN